MRVPTSCRTRPMRGSARSRRRSPTFISRRRDVLLHKLCLDPFQHSAAGACLEASVRHVFFAVQAADLKDSPSAKAVAERHEAWKADLPTDEAALWDWLAALDETSRTALLAHCV